jgi:hypothetical protein
MKLVADSGLWTTGQLVAPTPLVAVLEVSGAVLSWTVDDPSGAAQITFTDLRRADWLWRVVGQSGHIAMAAAVAGCTPDEPQTVDLNGVDVLPGSLDPLRHLALGHWLRRWWPASQRDGIAGLDHALLDAEIALLTAAAQDFFTDDTLDSDVAELLGPHAAALIAHAQKQDPRIVELVQACSELADDVGVSGLGWPGASAAQEVSGRRRDDYALAAAGDTGQPASGAIARGVESIKWGGVPPGIFDAAEDTVDWSIAVTGSAAVAEVRAEVAEVSAAVAEVRAAVSGPDSASGIVVRLRSGAVSGAGVLDAGGRATLPLVDAQQQPMTESAAWDHDWRITTVTIGADVEESRQTRERIRDFARARLAQPAGDAFLAEILAAESAY